MRQDVTKNLCAKGAYRLREASAARKVVLVATGSEVSLALEIAEKLEAAGQGSDVVLLVSTELFDEQNGAYPPDILPRDALNGSIQAGADFCWELSAGGDGVGFGLVILGPPAPVTRCY